MNDITEKLAKNLKKSNIYRDEPMSKHTSFRIGGIADYFVKVESEEELKFVLNLAKNENIPLFLIGNGTNLLVCEAGVRGIVVKMEQADYSIEKNEDFAYITVKARNDIGKTSIDCFGK